MRICLITCLVFLAVILPVLSMGCSEEPDWQGLPHGEIILPNFEDPDSPGAYFDFSKGELVYGEEGREHGDIYLSQTFICGNAAYESVALHLQQPDSILYDNTAPGWGSNQWQKRNSETSPARVAVRNEYNIWVITIEGHTAKLRIREAILDAASSSYPSVIIEWIYQPDGSTSLTGEPESEGETAVTDETDASQTQP